MNEIGNYTLHNLVEIFVPLQTIFVSYCGCFVYLCECMCSIVASVVFTAISLPVQQKTLMSLPT